MTLYLVTIRGQRDRERAHQLVEKCPYGARIEFKAAKRTLPQNDKMWACLTDVARQVKWHGLTLTPDDWKLIFLDGLKKELKIVPNIDGTGFVNIGRSSSKLTKQEMADLIELILMFGANHEVNWSYKEEGHAATPQDA